MIKKRPPIVTIFGHIDHGKSSLLDAIQKSNIVQKEAGGITQKVSAYEITYNDNKITFIDTPGHEAFAELRKRGAKIADIAILVIAADEGVKPQTIESINYIKNNNLPFIVAINKIDKTNANPDRVKQQLAEIGIFVEEWGGDVPAVNVSATKNIGLNDLLDLIILMGDILNLSYDDESLGEGYILESFKDNKKGIIAGAIVTNGRIKIGDYITTSHISGKIKFLEDAFGRKINEAQPSSPVLIYGFEDLPLPGEVFKITTKKDIEKTKLELNQEYFYRKEITVENSTLNINLVIKVDYWGSLSALENILSQISQIYKVSFKIVKGDVGFITTEDLKLSKQTNSFIINFNLKIPNKIYEEIKNLSLILIDNNIIYDVEEKIIELIDSLKNKSDHKGEIEVLALFNKTASKKTVGGKVILGSVKINDRVIILRDNKIIGKGKVINLKINKNDVNEVNESNLCGLLINTRNDIEVGDKLLII
jgi:translation initiation factor IF-2